MKILPKLVLLLALLCVPTYKALNHDYVDTEEYMDDFNKEAEMAMSPVSRGLNTAAQAAEANEEDDATETESHVVDQLSSPVDVATMDEFSDVPSQEGIINIDTNSEIEHNRNFVKISSDIKAYEDAYKACLDAISDSDFAMEPIEHCVGVDYQYVYDDIDYERRKILARADNAIRIDMIRLCYNEAGADLVLDNACDLMQKDALDLMWDELNFEILIEYHREKYVFTHAKMPDDVFTKVLNRFKDIYTELTQLVDELYAHRDLTIARLKRHIDERTTVIADKFREQADHPTPKIKKDLITIDETLIDHPNYYVPLDQLPRPMLENGQDQSYAVGGNPWVETFAHNIGPDHYAAINTPYQIPEFDDPPNVFNDIYKKRKLTKTGAGAQSPGRAVRVQGRPDDKRLAQIMRHKIMNMGRAGRFGYDRGPVQRLGAQNRSGLAPNTSARPTLAGSANAGKVRS